MSGNRKPSRREALRLGALFSGGLLGGSVARLDWSATTAGLWNAPFAKGEKIGSVDFVGEGQGPMDTPMGSELDGRLFTDISNLPDQASITPTEKFYIRTRASTLLSDLKSWRVRVDGLVSRPQIFIMENLNKLARPAGPHLLECAGNGKFARFGMISVARWEGVPMSEILDEAGLNSSATQVLITGFDRYAAPSVNSIPGASWIFSLEDIKAANAILATKMNGEPLTLDHGAPARLLVPGWYGCACIKWVNQISVVDDRAEATSQMQEYAGRTLQDGVPRLAKEYRPARIEPAAMPIRVEKYAVGGKIEYRVVGILWGGSQPVKVLQIRFNPDEDFVPVDSVQQTANDPWTLWTHTWHPAKPGLYAIRLAIADPKVQARKLESGSYVRSVEITDV